MIFCKIKKLLSRKKNSDVMKEFFFSDFMCIAFCMMLFVLIN